MIRIRKCEVIRNSSGQFILVATSKSGACYTYLYTFDSAEHGEALAKAILYNQAGWVDPDEWSIDCPKPIMIEVANVVSEDSPIVDKLKNLLEGRTYMKFQILVCPIGGSFAVYAETYADCETEETVRDFLIGVLVRAL